MAMSLEKLQTWHHFLICFNETTSLKIPGLENLALYFPSTFITCGLFHHRPRLHISPNILPQVCRCLICP